MFNFTNSLINTVYGSTVAIPIPKIFDAVAISNEIISQILKFSFYLERYDYVVRD